GRGTYGWRPATEGFLRPLRWACPRRATRSHSARNLGRSRPRCARLPAGRPARRLEIRTRRRRAEFREEPVEDWLSHSVPPAKPDNGEPSRVSGRVVPCHDVSTDQYPERPR